MPKKVATQKKTNKVKACKAKMAKQQSQVEKPHGHGSQTLDQLLCLATKAMQRAYHY